MTRLMGDAIHDNVPALRAVPGLQLVAGYVTGSPDIIWTQADWLNFPAELPRVTIDQGFTGSPVASAIVRDVEPGAWSPANAVNRAGWIAARPTIYCDRNDLPAVLGLGWQGDLWLAFPGWQPGQPLPATPGCNIVAVQYNLGASGPYDLSYVLDPFWPLEAPMALTAYQPGSVGLFYTPSGLLRIYGVGQDNRVYVSDLNPDGTTANTAPVTFPLTFT